MARKVILVTAINRFWEWGIVHLYWWNGWPSRR